MTNTGSVAPVPAVVHLSGGRRGTTERLAGDTLGIGTDVRAEIRLEPDRDLQPDRWYATLRRRGLTYALDVAPGTDVWVNGQPTDGMVLASGDVIEIGRGGPVLRFRLYEPGSAAWKSPMGIRALLVRTDVEFVSALEREGPQDFWSVARQLSERGYVAPLASRGIVAQAAQGVVVYDAATTHGGSGGPVLDLDGRVVAVTSGGIPQFGGSNLGIPAVAVREMLRTVP